MRTHLESCRRIFYFMIAMTFLCPALPALSYEREIANLSSILAAGIVKSGKKSIAVVDFTDLQGRVNELGRFIAEEISGSLTSQSQGFDVLDRNHIKRIIEEQKLSMSGLMDPSAIKKIGKLAGTDIIVTGTITPFGDSIRVSCKAIDTETAKVTGSARGDIAKTVTIADLLKLGVIENSRLDGTPERPAGKTDGAVRPAVERKKVAPGKITWDFETGDLRGWQGTGTAFQTQPTFGDNPTARHRGQPSNHQGDYWIGGYENRHSPSDPPGRIQGDGPQGTLTSVPFTITTPAISFLIGGGCDINTERVELVVDDRVVQRATGRCTETMERMTWDVRSYQGQSAQIRLIDHSGGGWGHINFDDVRF
ncbi:MAG: FlgO family outer membrane protein [Syntrophales bacterium]